MVDTQQATDKSEKSINIKKKTLIININIFLQGTKVCINIIKSISNQIPENLYKKYN